MRENESSQMESYANWKAPDTQKKPKKKGMIDTISRYIPGTAAHKEAAEAAEKASPLTRRVVALQEGITALWMRRDIIQVDKDKMLDRLKDAQRISINLLKALGHSEEKIARLTARREADDDYINMQPERFMEKMDVLAMARVGEEEEGGDGAEAA